MVQSDLRFELSQIDVQVHDTTVIALVLRMQAGVVEHIEHQVIRGQDVRDQVLDSVGAGNVSEPPKQNGSYSAQVIVVGHDDRDLRGGRSTADHVACDADQRSGFEGAQCVVLTAAVSEPCRPRFSDGQCAS